MNTSLDNLTHKMQRAALGKIVDVALSRAEHLPAGTLFFHGLARRGKAPRQMCIRDSGSLAHSAGNGTAHVSTA